jgi:hypothetical protein
MIIGREKEQKELLSLLEKEESQARFSETFLKSRGRVSFDKERLIFNKGWLFFNKGSLLRDRGWLSKWQGSGELQIQLNSENWLRL